jgi:hypothetical protein
MVIVTTGPTVTEFMASHGINPALNADALSVIPFSEMVSAGFLGLSRARSVHRNPEPNKSRFADAHTETNSSPTIPDFVDKRKARGVTATKTKHPMHRISILLLRK